MSQYNSTGLINFVASQGSLRQALANCRVILFAGSVPGGAGLAGGTVIATLTKGGGAFTAETLAIWQFALTGGASGTVDSVKIGDVELLTGGAVSYSSDLSTTAALVAAAINGAFTTPDYTATNAGATVIITAPVGSGTMLNNLTLAVGSTTITHTETSAGAATTPGVAAVNGGNWNYTPSSGVLSKEATAWSGVAGSSGPYTASYFRIVADNDDGVVANDSARRLQGAIGTSGQELNLSSVSIANGASISISSWDLTVRST